MYEDLTYEELLERMLRRVSGRFDKREGSVIWDTHSPAAIELKNLYIALDSIIQEAYGDTATREFLIMRCRERGIVPYRATHAVLKGEFAPDNIDMTGRRFNIGQVNYMVTEKLAEGGYKVRCETEGEEGNRYLGAMTPIEYTRGLESAELTEILIPGEEEEDTEALRERYFSSFDNRAFGGNVQDYMEKVNAIAGVGAVRVTRAWNGDIHPSQMIPTDKVWEWYRETIGTMEEEPAQWLRTVYRAASQKKLTTGGTVLITILNSEYDVASGTLVETVQNAIDPEEGAGEGYGLAPIGHVVSVQSAAGVEISVRTEILFENGYNREKLQKTIDSTVIEYFSELRKRWADTGSLVVRISQIETRILGVRGVVDIGETALNGRKENFTMGPYEVPVFGGVSV